MRGWSSRVEPGKRLGTTMREAELHARPVPARGRKWRWPAALAALGFAVTAVAASPIQLNAEAWLLRDFHTGRILAEENADQRMEPASLVKLMTSYVAFAELAAEDLALDEMVTVSRKAWRMGGSQMFIEVGSRVSVEDLLKGIIVQSGNDASVALAEHVAGTEEAFVVLMNEHAARLGMTGTSYANSHGLPDENNYTTARDVAILVAALMADFPERYRWHELDSFTFNGITQPNRNRLLKRDSSVDGGKTGFTNAAGYCLAVSANREGMRVIAVVMGAPRSSERFRAAQALLNYGYRNFQTTLVYAGREPIGTVRVWSGERPAVKAGIASDLWLTVERRKSDRIDTKVAFDDPLIAPVPEAGRVGTLEVTLGDEKLAERELVALAEVPPGSLYRRALDWFWLFWR